MDSEKMTDKVFAQKICRKIQSGDQEAINKIRKKYHKSLADFARQSLSNPGQTEEFMQEYWAELSDGKLICEYSELKGDESLKAFLLNILSLRIYKRNIKTDKSEADKICNELRSGNKDAIRPLMDKYNDYLTENAKRKLCSFNPDPHWIEEVVNNVWIAISGKDSRGEYRICKYNEKSTLKTYLTAFLKNKVYDEKQRIMSEKRKRADELDKLSYHTNDNKYKNEELQEIIHEALLQFDESSPKDARLIMMYLKGLSFREMAMQDLKGSNASERDIERKYNAVRQQFNRAGTGSVAKFKKELKRYMKKNDLNYGDFFN